MTYHAPSDRPHGTYAQYKRGCRCEDCAEYQRARVADNRMTRVVDNRLSHGTRSAYDAGCRCSDCRKARHDAHVREQQARSAS